MKSLEADKRWAGDKLQSLDRVEGRSSTQTKPRQWCRRDGRMKRVDIPAWFHRISMIVVAISFLCGIEDRGLVPVAIGLVCLFMLAVVAVLLQNATKRGSK